MKEFRWINSIIEKKDYFYCFPGYGNALYRVSMENFVVEKVAEFENQERATWSLVELNNVICCICNKNSRIYTYEVNTKEKATVDAQINTEIMEAFVFADKIWFIPRDLMDNLYYITISDGIFHEVRGWKEEIQRLNIIERVFRWFRDNGEVYFVLMDKSYILKYNLKTYKLTELTPPLSKPLYDFVIHKKHLFLIDADRKSIYCWDIRNDEIKEIKGDGKTAYSRMVNIGDSILIDTDTGVEIYTDGRIVKTQIAINKGSSKSAFIKAIKYKSSWLLLPWGNEEIVILDENSIYGSRNLGVSARLTEKRILIESDISLNNYIDFLNNNERKLY